MISLLLMAAWSFAAEPSKPKIAVVIDDFGLTYPKNIPDEKWMAIPWPITFAVMPESPRTPRSAKETKASGHELIIHFPFDPFLALDLPKDKVSPRDLEKLRKLFDKAFKQIPGPVGLNNHRSYRATQNRPIMEAFMKLYKSKGLYFLDSKVSDKSVAFAEAKKAGIPAARNYIFLEDARHPDKNRTIKFLRAAAARAKKEGSVVAIGHHYFRATYEGLMEEVPKLQAEGFEFVFLSSVVE